MTASRYDLLPPNATQLERDFSRSISSLERAGRPVPVIRTAKRVDIPDGVVPWLVFEYGLGELLPYIENQRTAIADGVPWQRIRGTPQALLTALEWIGVDGELDESEAGSARWAEYQIGLPAPVEGEAIIRRIIGVAEISQPQRSRLQRIFSVYDHRRFVLDDSLLSEGSPLSDHTGTRPIPGGPQISFGDYHATLIDGEPTLQLAFTLVLAVEVPYRVTFLLDDNLIDEDWHKPQEPIARTDIIPASLYWEEGAALQWGAFPWLAQPWSGGLDTVGGSITTVS